MSEHLVWDGQPKPLEWWIEKEAQEVRRAEAAERKAAWLHGLTAEAFAVVSTLVAWHEGPDPKKEHDYVWEHNDNHVWDRAVALLDKGRAGVPET